MDNKKYVIVCHNQERGITTYFGGTPTIKNYQDIVWLWYSEIGSATPLTRSEAENLLEVIVDYYKKNIPNTHIGAKIHEYIPPQIGEEVKSEKDEILDGLKYCLSMAHPAVREHGHLKKAIAFIEKNTK